MATENLPLYIDEFPYLRKNHFVYIDKTEQLARLSQSGKKYFIARPYGFGKSLALSTLAAMFSGQSELFAGLAAFEFVQACANNPHPILSFDFSVLPTGAAELFENSLVNTIRSLGKKYSIDLSGQSPSECFIDLITQLSATANSPVVLIDNYDKPIQECFENTELVLKIHEILRSFYKAFEASSEYLRLLIITGEVEFHNVGVFSTIRTIRDISLAKNFADLYGFTQNELENTFSSWFVDLAKEMSVTKETLLQDLANEITPCCFATKTSVYHPSTLLHCLQTGEISNYKNILKTHLTQFTPEYLCINQGDSSFLNVRDFEFYVDKTELLHYTNKFLDTDRKYICISRPRRFGKTISVHMVSAYYDYSGKAQSTFKDLKIVNDPSFPVYANKYIVIKITIQTYLSKYQNIDIIIEKTKEDIIADLLRAYVDGHYYNDINVLMKSVAKRVQKKFVIVIDEWDCIFREFKEKDDWQEKYLDFLRSWFKDQDYIALVYMTGILPIKKYGTHSALNMFDEYSMISAAPFSEFIGFTEVEVQNLCKQYKRDFDECKSWYDGYQIDDFKSIYNPRSVNRYISSGLLQTYWSYTESYEALRIYITMKNFGLHDTITKLLANVSVPVRTETFANDMKTFYTNDDILTLLIHLGYLAYDGQTGSVRIPNKEIAGEFVKSISTGGWPKVVAAIQNSQKLLEAVLNLDAETVARGIEAAHLETSQLQYNDENALAYTISLAFFAAREHYTIVREFPTGKGFADLVFLPRANSSYPMLLVELKWHSTAEAALAQIHERQYPHALAERTGQILLVGINYDRKTKQHSCCLERFQL
ncbi:MAG: AAA family ATPase [Desulfovibrio sp.]|nr:AAA family ATPase [Desulfovibrio sp.]